MRAPAGRHDGAATSTPPLPATAPPLSPAATRRCLSRGVCCGRPHGCGLRCRWDKDRAAGGGWLTSCRRSSASRPSTLQRRRTRGPRCWDAERASSRAGSRWRLSPPRPPCCGRAAGRASTLQRRPPSCRRRRRRRPRSTPQSTSLPPAAASTGSVTPPMPAASPHAPPPSCCATTATASPGSISSAGSPASLSQSAPGDIQPHGAEWRRLSQRVVKTTLLRGLPSPVARLQRREPSLMISLATKTSRS
mmetsp:Transcript_32869/g.94351  ORF Transcript_32869/g.94351 Transcript_32869/m.94351 type:complete len:249 (+) Transcript_32869:575-1321(+)